MGIEIERKWMVRGWPHDYMPLLKEEVMRQGYVSVTPTVRIREEKCVYSSEISIKEGSDCVCDDFILCFKSKGGLSRKEIEFSIEKKYFDEISELIGLPLIAKTRRTYLVSNGSHLEVNHVDQGLPGEFWYAEIEFESEEEANGFDPKEYGLGDYLVDDVTGQKGSSMGEYWLETRVKK